MHLNFPAINSDRALRPPRKTQLQMCCDQKKAIILHYFYSLVDTVVIVQFDAQVLIDASFAHHVVILKVNVLNLKKWNNHKVLNFSK